MSYVLAFDPSTKVLGWCAMDTDTGDVLAHGVEDITVPRDGGWQHDRIKAAVATINHGLPPGLEGWTMEKPHATSMANANKYGSLMRSLEVVCRSQWQHAIVYAPYEPTVWRSMVGAGKRGKAGAMAVAQGIVGPGVTLTQDEADAICIARALTIEHYDWETTP